jgi:glutathione S-transferase
MKLYHAPGACSRSPLIVATEAGVPLDLVKVTLRTHTLDDGTDYYSINPNGYVPLLVLDDGTQLTEGPAIVQYLADQRPASGLAPANGTLARYQLQSWLNFISTEIHKGFSPLFNPAVPDAYKTMARERLIQRLGNVEQRLAEQAYLTGATFTVADAYLFTVLGWSKSVGIDLERFPGLVRYVDRVAARPGVRKALEAESGR